MKAPTTYSDWLPIIERFEGGDDTALVEMRAGELEWSNVVAQRWTAHISRAITTRLQAISRQLQLGFSRSRGDLFAVAQAMLGARRSLAVLAEAATIPCMPNDVRTHLVSELTRFVDESQASLEKSAMQNGRSGEPVLRVLRENRLRLMPVVGDRKTNEASETAVSQTNGSRYRKFLGDLNG